MDDYARNEDETGSKRLLMVAQIRMPRNGVTSRKVSFDEKRNPDSVLSLLTSYGFTDSQISSIITDCPQVDVEKSLGPKLQYFAVN
ncbi:unnamed protein product [Microthlaspi erraticum]|uniref:Uncharacterized protein n=1 Tax=Microthlaspi erraticum TaxID=1685480 RepID=A0A6D2HBV5_9BRAS|nr:unnamed protein product [Microthlaspi erraticum]